ncbi:signal peptidase I [Streptococcaceae bacterium ESL0729]|nr:signal peptidase I [Streptococcaceae bacterium ESL0729]
MKFIREWGFVIFIGLVMLLSRIYLWAPVSVSGHSMDPTLADKQYLIMIRSKDFKRSDIVVAKETDNGETKDIIKRVIGLPGDKVVFKDDVLTINGEVIKEDYLDDYKAKFKEDKLQATYAFDSFFQERAANSKAFTVDAQGNPDFEIDLADDQYLLLGDNRIVSKDSRQVGSFTKEEILGKAKFRLFPLKTLGPIK